MRTRILLFILAFAFLPSCKKTPSSPTPEAVAKAEAEIREVAVKVSNATIDLEKTTATGEALARKTKLDELKTELLETREKNKEAISMERSKEISDRAIEETRKEREESNRKIAEEYKESVKQAEEEAYKKQEKFNNASPDEQRRMLEDSFSK